MTEPIGLSTSWNGPGSNPQRLLEQDRGLGFRRVEAYAHFTHDALRALASEAARCDMHIGSLHGPCPVPSGPSGYPAPLGDWLASTNPSERNRSVDALRGTIDAAVEVGARAIVVHLGNSGAVSRQNAIFDTINRQGRLSDEHLRLRDSAWQEREAVKGPHLEAALESMRALGAHARGTGVRLGVECRDNYVEIPSLDEFSEVLSACDGLPVGYWHDAGHGAKLDYLGFLEHEDFLRRYGQQIVGMHIHDTRAGRDHLAPGLGDTDFSMLGRYLLPETIRTLELNRMVTPTEITYALDLLEPLGVFGVREGILVELLKKGQVRHTCCCCAGHGARGGNPSGMAGSTDIRERKEAEAGRAETSVGHGERLRALGEMASGIAHDLNQSLALITGYSEIAYQELNQTVPDITRVREMVEITARAALEGGEALRGLLSFVSTQQVTPEAERMDAGAVLQEAARLTAPRWRDASQAEGRPIELDVTVDPGCALNGSPAALREAITNLIFNAVDALPSGGTIHLTACAEGEWVVLEVRDSGTGIPSDVQSRVFDPFFTTKGERGTGLGLSQVTAIVKRHGGTIELRSTPSHGTTFRLKFPRAGASARRAAHPSAQAAVSAPKRRIRILVVEDEKQLARMASLVLTQRGHHVVVASTGEDALEQLEREQFELIVSDLGLGSGKNGWDLAQTVRARWPETHFVLVTGWGAAINQKDAQLRGVHEVISKPYRIADLRQVADRLAGATDAG